MWLCWLQTKVSAFRRTGALSDRIVEAFRSLPCQKAALPVTSSLLPDGRGTSEASEPWSCPGITAFLWETTLISHRLSLVLAGISKCLPNAVQGLQRYISPEVSETQSQILHPKRKKDNISAKFRMVLAAAAT